MHKESEFSQISKEEATNTINTLKQQLTEANDQLRKLQDQVYQLKQKDDKENNTNVIFMSPNVQK